MQVVEIITDEQYRLRFEAVEKYRFGEHVVLANAISRHLFDPVIHAATGWSHYDMADFEIRTRAAGSFPRDVEKPITPTAAEGPRELEVSKLELRVASFLLGLYHSTGIEDATTVRARLPRDESAPSVRIVEGMIALTMQTCIEANIGNHGFLIPKAPGATGFQPNEDLC